MRVQPEARIHAGRAGDSVPGGLAIFDYNGNGRPDIFFTNGAQTPSLEMSSEDANRQFRNDGNMRFTDVTDTTKGRPGYHEVPKGMNDVEPRALREPSRLRDTPPSSNVTSRPGS